MTVASVAVDPPLKAVPMKFVTTENYAIGHYDNKVFQADMDCSSLEDSNIDVCAELPRNWEWDPFKGYVYINLFNDPNDTKNVSDVLSWLIHIVNGWFCTACLPLNLIVSRSTIQFSANLDEG